MKLFWGQSQFYTWTVSSQHIYIYGHQWPTDLKFQEPWGLIFFKVIFPPFVSEFSYAASGLKNLIFPVFQEAGT